jgi:hypothetical protein
VLELSSTCWTRSTSQSRLKACSGAWAEHDIDRVKAGLVTAVEWQRGTVQSGQQYEGSGSPEFVAKVGPDALPESLRVRFVDQYAVRRVWNPPVKAELEELPGVENLAFRRTTLVECKETLPTGAASHLADDQPASAGFHLAAS